MSKEVCDICANEAELLDSVCRSCNPESHADEDLTQLDHFIRNGAFVFDLSDEVLELWEKIKDQYKEKVASND